jgi:hypothetical protein
MLSYACQQSPSAIDVQLSTTRDALADAAAGGFVAPRRQAGLDARQPVTALF